MSLLYYYKKVTGGGGGGVKSSITPRKSKNQKSFAGLHFSKDYRGNL